VRPKDRGIAKPIAGGVRVPVPHQVRGFSVARRGDAVEIQGIGRKAGLVGSRSVGQTYSGAEHCLGVDLIGGTQAWSEGPRVIMIETAIARGFVKHGACPIAGGGIRRVKCRALEAAILLSEQSDVVVSQTVVERKLASHLPGVLDVIPEVM